MIKYAVATAGFMLLCQSAAVAQDNPDLATMLVGNWQDGDVRLVIEQKNDRDKTMLLTDKRKGREQDHHWKQVGKTESGKPIKFSYLPEASEIPDKTDTGKPITDKMKADARATTGDDRFQWLVEFTTVDNWGKCSATLHASFYPGTIDYDLKDDGKTVVEGSFKAKSGGTSKSITYKRLDPAINFVEGTGGANKCTPHPISTTSRCSITIYKFIFPGSDYDSATGKQSAASQVKDAKDFFADYCIDLTDQEWTLNAADEKKLKLKERYEAWYADVLANEMGGDKTRLGKNSITGAHRSAFKELIGALQTHLEGNVKPAGTTPLIVFMNEYIGGSDFRDTLVSSSQESIDQAGINSIDQGSPHMLTHELIHLLGKPAAGATGGITWGHNSICANAVSRVTRTDARATEDLSNRYLDIEEYKEIVKNKAAGKLKCETIKY